MTAALQASGLGKRYRRTWALSDCNLVVPQGRIAALVGPNGAGKTTLLHLAVGLLAPTAGAISVLGKAGAASRLGRLGIPLDRKAGALSGGQRAQLALTIALAKRPALLLDEPLASLDPLARREFLQTLMGAVAEDGVTVVLSSHLLADLERVCDYLIVLAAARVQVLGAVDELLEAHKVLIGPYRPDQRSIAGVAQAVRSSHTDKQATLLVRTDGPVLDPAWKAHEVTLDDLVLAYLAEPSAGVLPGPSASIRGLEVQA